MGANIIDPNEIISSDAFRAVDIEGMPDISSMYIFAELKAQRRSSSTLVSNGTGRVDVNSNNEDIKVNFMGVDSATNSLTTKWTRNNDESQNEEGFGIQNININVNSSYVPVVDIEFVDIRGNSLFTTGKKSKYSVLFSFPPPIYTLTVKGYYGKALSYSLHLVRQTTKFDSDSGNFIISANFVGMKYAPLTDIPFKFIDIVPLMNDNGSSKIDSVNFDPSQDPKNTRELIIRSQKLYDDIEEAKVNSQIAKDADKFREDYNNAQKLLTSLDDFRIYMDSELQSDTISGFYIVEKQGHNNATESNLNNYVGGTIKRTNLNAYESLVRINSPNQSASKINSKLYILVDVLNIPTTGSTTVDNKFDRIKKSLTNVKEQILGQAIKVNSELKGKTLISDVIDKNLKGKNEDTKKDATYFGLDVTEYFIKLTKDVDTKKNKFNKKQNEFKAKVNDIAINNLGKAPTIGTIFKILCDDVDVFFNKLKKVDEQAEKHHTDNYNKIVNVSTTKKGGKISAFPLILKNETYNDLNPTQSGKQSSVVRTNRGYPSDVLTSLTDPFPECNFIDTFINAYLSIIKSEEAFRLKEAKDDKGNNKWIPINPFDSEILGNTSVNSPYVGKTSPIPDMISEMVNRFYVISQYSYDRQFYAKNSKLSEKLLNFFGKATLHTDLIKFISHGEAANLVNSISDTNLLKGLSTQASTWKNSLTNFYDTLDKNVKVKGPTGDDVNIYKSFQIAGNPSGDLIDDQLGTSFLLINDGTTTITKNKKSKDFVGFNLITDDEISLRITGDDGSNNEDSVNAVEKFVNEYGSDTIKNFIFDSYKFDAFTKQNIMYIKDHKREDGDDVYDSDFINEKLIDSIYSLNLHRSPDKRLDTIISSTISESGFVFQTILNDPTITNNVKLFLIVSLFGNTSSYTDPLRDVNKKFSFPAIVEVPKYAHLYMGGLTYFFRNPSALPLSELVTYNTKYGNKFIKINDSYNGAKNVAFLSQSDADKLTQYFLDFAEDNTDTGYGTLETLFVTLIDEIKLVNSNTPINMRNKSTFLYEEALKRLTGDGLTSGINKETNTFENNYTSLLNKLNGFVYVVNYTQITFYPDDGGADKTLPYFSDDFVPLSIVNNNSENKAINDQYFLNFFSEIIKLTDDREKEIKQTENSVQNSINNNDIKTQIYYSLKNISDKWVMGLDGGSVMGSKKLFDDFIFVDRAFNDISEKVVIDFKPLIEMSKDFDVSVFTVMSKLLSLNGFEFFPLQNFMNFKNDDWKNTFRIFDSPKLAIAENPKFVCMYVGGYSSQLDDGGDYVNDGIDDLNKLPDYKSGNVFGFDVYFAKQNQSIFTNIELNTNEHKETNESLSILSQLAQDQSASSPVGIGQNLFSTYEQRSYTCKVEMLGDIMIQPTQYFILKNVPMFNGAYIILQAEHHITANHMRTNFTGVRMRGIPQPFVRDFATSVGLQSGRADGTLTQTFDSIDPNLNAASIANITVDQTGRLLSPT